jgi:hypothetical protein
MDAIVDRVIEISRVFAFACVADDAVRLAVVLAIGVLVGLIHLSTSLRAEPTGRPSIAMFR